MLNKLTNKNYHILHIAALHNHPKIISYLLTSPECKKLELNPNSIDGDRCTLLHHAARKGCLESIKKILELIPDILYKVDVRSNTALHYAAMNGISCFYVDHASSVKYLLYFDSDFDKLRKMGNTKGKLPKDLTVNKKCF